MQEYYFLFALAFVWTLFATIQDIRSREVANWLNFSLVAFALAYRAFYATKIQDIQFFLFGLIGFGIFLVLAYGFYYMKAFAGGDAKLLIGFGIILPYQNYFDLATLTLSFLFALFLIGAVYSLIYSALIVARNKKEFTKEFKNRASKHKLLLLASLIVLATSIVFSFNYPIALFVIILSIIPLIHVYTNSLDKCMLVILPPNKLTEGDWLEEPVKINNKITIKKTVHGLTLKDIQILKKYKRSVQIKQGIPFVPAFLITLLLMALFFLVSKYSLQELFLSAL